MATTANTPQDCHQLFVTHTQSRDLEGLVGLFDDDALLVRPSTSLEVANGNGPVEVRGHAALRETLKTYLSRNPKFEVEETTVHESGDVALVSARWKVEGQRPDGSKLQMAHTSNMVVRRGPDGSWRIVINRAAVDDAGSSRQAVRREADYA